MVKHQAPTRMKCLTYNHSVLQNNVLSYISANDLPAEISGHLRYNTEPELQEAIYWVVMTDDEILQMIRDTMQTQISK